MNDISDFLLLSAHDFNLPYGAEMRNLFKDKSLISTARVIAVIP